MFQNKATNSKNTSPHETITVRNKRPLVCTTENYLKNGNSDYTSIIKKSLKVLVVGYSHVKRLQRNDFNKELKNDKALFSGPNTK